MVTLLLTGLIRITLLTSPLILALYFLSPVLRRRYSPKWLCTAWTVLAVRLLIPLYREFVFFFPQIEETPPTVYSNTTFAFGAHVLPNLESEIWDSSGILRHFSWISIVIIVWCTGFLVYALYHLWGMLRFRRALRRSASPVDDPEILSLFEELVTQTGIRRRVALKHCPFLTSPMAYGLFRPVVLLPSTGCSREQLPLILRHELVHIRRGHLLLKLLLTAACAVHWFNPFVHLMVRWAQRDIELACDAEVVQGTDAELRGQYSRAILAAAGGGSGPRLSVRFQSPKKALKLRFQTIFDTASKRKGRGVLLLLIACTAASGVFVSCGVNHSPAADGLIPPSNNTTYHASNVQWQKLLECKTDYVGDNSKVVHAVDLLPLPGGAVRDSVSLQTKEQPYGFTIHYSTEQDLTQQAIATFDRACYNNAIVLFSLIGNADRITVELHNLSSVYTFSYTRQMADQVFGQDVRELANNQDFPGLISRTLLTPNEIQPLDTGEAAQNVLPVFRRYTNNPAEDLLYQTITALYDDGDPSTVTLAHFLGCNASLSYDKIYAVAYVGRFRLRGNMLDQEDGGFVSLKLTARDNGEGSLELLSVEGPQQGENWRDAIVRLCSGGDENLSEILLHNCADADSDGGPAAVMEYEVEEYARKSELNIQYYRIGESTMPLVKRRYEIS